MDRGAVTYFSWAALGYSFKFVWAPLIDKLPLPFLAGILGQRRSWMLVAQMLIIAAIVLMAMSDPATAPGLATMAVAAVMLGFSAATQFDATSSRRSSCSPVARSDRVSASTAAR